jgi:hypothetical protein
VSEPASTPSAPAPRDTAAFDALTGAEAVRTLLVVCSSRPWAEQVGVRRPYGRRRPSTRPRTRRSPRSPRRTCTPPWRAIRAAINRLRLARMLEESST